MNSNHQRIPVIGKSQAGRALSEDSVVIVDCETAAYRMLNSSASFLWSLIDGKRTVGDLEASLVEHYQIDSEDARRDLEIFLNDLLSKNILQWQPQEVS